MSTFQDILDNVALLIGGTAPDLTNNPGFYSGAQANGGAGDGTGVAGLIGCYSRPPGNLIDWPVGLVLPGPFTAKRGTPEEEHDKIRVLVLVGPNDPSTSWAALNPFRDLVPAAMRAKMQITPAGGTTLSPTVLEAPVEEGKPVVQPWGNTDYLGWEFTLDLFRAAIRTYTA